MEDPPKEVATSYFFEISFSFFGDVAIFNSSLGKSSFLGLGVLNLSLLNELDCFFRGVSSSLIGANISLGLGSSIFGAKISLGLGFSSIFCYDCTY